MFGGLKNAAPKVPSSVPSGNASQGSKIPINSPKNLGYKPGDSVKITSNIEKACFTAETLIYTKEGHKPIKEIKKGDEVYTQNIYTGEKGLKAVKNVFEKEISILIHITIGE